MNCVARTVVLLALPVFAACGGGSGDGGASNNGGGNCPAEGQQVSMPCCLDHGVDACGALLFCAAFDGRTEPTCYPERSRADSASCSEDRQCISGACNAVVGACRATPGMPCDLAIGCAPLPDHTRTACVGESGRCEPLRGGALGDPCETIDDCLEGNACLAGRCTFQWDCPLAQGTGPCSVSNLDPEACDACKHEAYEGCNETCWDESQALVDCIDAQGCSPGDEICRKERCAATYCARLTCIAGDCPAYRECY